VTKSIKTGFFLFTLLVSTQSVLADELDTNISSDSVRVIYTAPIGGADYGRKNITMGALYNKDDNFFFDAGLHIIDEAGSKIPGMEVGIGPKAYIGQTETEDYLTFGFEALANYRLATSNRFLFSGNVYYSPSIIAFIDADELWELNFRASYELIPSASVYVGFRKIRVKVNVKRERLIDDGFYFGLKMEF